jgi:hypothetical protein
LSCSTRRPVKKNFESKIHSDKREAISTATKSAIGFMTEKYGFNIIEPSKYFTEVQKAIKAELVHLANGARAYEDWACEAINDIHNLAGKYNNFVSRRDTEIKNMLFAICVDLS